MLARPYSSPLLPYRWTWPVVAGGGAALRNAQSVSAADVGATGLQVDINREYVLLAQSGGVPTLWGEKPCNLCTNPGIELRTTVGTGFTWLGGVPVVTGAAAVAGGPFTTTKASALPRIRYPVGSAAGNQYALIRASGLTGFGSGYGFRYQAKVVNGVVSTNRKWHMGLSSTIPAGANVDPNTLLDSILIGRSSSSDANLQLYTNDGAGTAVKTDLATLSGLAFPSNTVDIGYELQVYSLDGTFYGWQVRHLDSGAEVSGRLATSDRPGTGKLLWSWYTTDGGDTTQVAIDLASMDWRSFR